MERSELERPDSREPESKQDPGPGPGRVSMNRDNSTEGPTELKDGQTDVIHQQRPDSPGPSLVSMKSDQSMGEPLTFRDGPHSVDKRTDKKTSEVPTDHSAQHQSHLDSIFMLLKENIVRFVKNELKKMQKVLSPDYPECL
ncbi:protein NLRC3-like protein, partial [Lates japonicus]